MHAVYHKNQVNTKARVDANSGAFAVGGTNGGKDASPKENKRTGQMSTKHTSKQILHQVSAQCAGRQECVFFPPCI